MLTTKQKPTLDTHRIKRKEQCTTTESHKFTKEDRKGGRKEQRNYKRARNQQDGHNKSHIYQ